MSTKRKTIEYARELYLSRGLILDEKEYINKSIKMDCHDLDGYKYSLSLSCVNDKRTKRFEPIGKYNPYFVENVENFIKINEGNCRLKTREYIKSEEKLELECSCGETYYITVCHLLGEKKFVCNKCAFKKSNKEKLIKGKADTIEKLNKIGYKLIEFKNKNDIVIVDKQGYLFNTTIFNAINEKFTFDVCQRFNKFNRFTIQNMLNYLTLNDINIKMVDETPRQIEVRKDYMDWYCIDCGEVFSATWGQVSYDNNLRATPRRRCEKCSKRQSNLEYIVEQYLIKKNIEYIKQYRFDDCRNKNPLPFDFYLPKYNTTIEVMGDQHYYESAMFTQSLEERIRIDLIKKDYCIKNNINYVEIPRWKITNKHSIKGYKILIDNILGQN